MGTESLLRNILTPNAQLESGYYLHVAELKNGDTAAGLLVSQDEDSVVMRAMGLVRSGPVMNSTVAIHVRPSLAMPAPT